MKLVTELKQIPFSGIFQIVLKSRYIESFLLNVTYLEIVKYRGTKISYKL